MDHSNHAGHQAPAATVDHAGHPAEYAGHDHATHHDHSMHSGHGDGGHDRPASPAGHDAHAGHDHAAHLAAAGQPHGQAATGRGWSAVSWAMAAQATLHCLIGCAIGEVLGMVLGTAFGLHNGATVVLSVALAFVFGYALTMRGVLRADVPWRTALKVALAADTVSIAVMEVLDNTVMVTVPGAMDAGLSSGLFWAALGFSLVVAFVLTTPVNRWMISRGKGHAVVHQYHHAH